MNRIFPPGSELSVIDGEVTYLRQAAPDMSARSLVRNAVGVGPVVVIARLTVRDAVLNEPFASATRVIAGGSSETPAALTITGIITVARRVMVLFMIGSPWGWVDTDRARRSHDSPTLNGSRDPRAANTRDC